MNAFDGTKREAMPGKMDLLRGCFVEFLAMTVFVYVGCGSAASNATAGDPASVTIIALTFGLAITVLVFATAHTSGGHVNCAVTFCLTLVGKCHPVRGVAYLISQLLGSIVGALLLKATTSGAGMDRTGGLGANGLQGSTVGLGNALVAEAMCTFFLCIVVLETAVNSHSVTTEGECVVKGNKQSLAPVAIGLAVFVAHTVCIPITGCSINPTRSFGPSLVASKWDDHWLWWAGPLSGAAIASLVWLAMKALDGSAPSMKPSKNLEQKATTTPSKQENLEKVMASC